MELDMSVSAPGRDIHIQMPAHIYPNLFEIQSRSVVVIPLSTCWSVQLAGSYAGGTTWLLEVLPLKRHVETEGIY